MKLLTNAIIHTFWEVTPTANALVIDRERILAVGDLEELRRLVTFPVEEYDLGQKVIIPGLVDSHIHLQQYAQGLQRIDCETTTKAQCLKRVKERANQTPPGEWILGHGWNQNNWVEGYGTIQELDAITSQHPVFLSAKSLHAAWVNTLAFQFSGIKQGAVDPPMGAFGRDEFGNFSGVIFENAVSLIENAIPAPSIDQIAEAIQLAQKDLWEKGLTGVHDFDRQRCFSALQLLHERGLLQLRVLKSLPYDNLDQVVEVGLRSGFGDDYLRIGGIKLFADGALGPRTAAMLEPYENEVENRGMSFFDGEELLTIGRKAVDSGLFLSIHAIGDRANHEVLNSLEQLLKYQVQISNPPQLPHRIEHVQIVHTEDAPRLAKSGIVASMQPIHATSDMLMAERYWGGRSRQAYAFKTQLEFGARLVFGSDAPVESPNPFLGVHAAVTRRRLDGQPGIEGWYPDERISVWQALEAYTSTPAVISGMGDRLGKIAPGYLADLVVLNQDPFLCLPDDLYNTKPVKTMVSGEWVFET